MLLNTNSSIDPEQYATGFNQGMEQAAQSFALMIQVLAASFLLKIIIRFPPVYKRINEATDYEVVQVVEYSADVLAFFITVMLYWSLQGNALIG